MKFWVVVVIANSMAHSGPLFTWDVKTAPSSKAMLLSGRIFAEAELGDLG